MQHKHSLWFLLTFLLLLFNHIPGQTQTTSRKNNITGLLEYTASRYEVNDRLIHGFIYSLPDSRIKGHPYYKENEWVRGTVYIGDDSFDEVWLKYDIAIDQVILKARFSNNMFRPIELNSRRVDSFKLHNTLFVNAKHYGLSDAAPHYLEQIIDQNLTFVRRHGKNFISKYDELTPLGQYSQTQSQSFFIEKGDMERIRGRGSFIRHFRPNRRKKIRKFIRNHQISYRKADKQQLQELLQYCNQNSLTE